MLDTILHIGKLVSEGRDPWEDIIAPIKIDNKGNKTYYQLDVLFDIDNQCVDLNIIGFDGRFPQMKKVGAIKVRGGNNKAIYPAIPANKLNQLVKTFFGKQNAEEGEMKNIIGQKYPSLKNTILYQLLPKIFQLKNQFDEYFLNPEKNKYDIRIAEKEIDLGKNDKIGCIAVKIKWSRVGNENCYFPQIEGFEKLVELELFSQSKSSSTNEGIDYTTGYQVQEVLVPSFSGRYNINKYFVQETCNYATNFEKKSFGKNYQLGPENQVLLDRGSTELLENYRVKIANQDHVLVPQVLHRDLEDLTIDALTQIQTKADLLFRLYRLDELVENMEEEVEYFWLNFLAIDSDGNYFKVSNLIKDVPSFHFESVSRSLWDTGKILRPWLGPRYVFNLGRMYFFIPVRKDLNKNPALLLFSAILEQRTIDKSIIFQHFNELILCHWYERYRAYANIKGGTNFDFHARDTVFTFLAFFVALKKLHLLKNDIFMDANVSSTSISEQIAQEESAFLLTMGYDTHQQALFYLGRALSRVAYAQQKSDHNKPVLNKLNYNGMDRRTIILLANDLMEKGNQYKNKDKNTLAVIERYLKAFFNLFPANDQDWNMPPQEALFFILSGYTYGIKSKDKTDSES